LITPYRRTQDIILVASDVQIRLALELALANQGYQRLQVLDFSEAMTHAFRTNPHLFVICSDDEGGDSAMYMARQLQRESCVANFIVIADSAGEEIEWSRFDDDELQVLSRPFSMLAFIAAVDRAL
jgi:DNA-binding response OmpR family regulator